MTTFYHWTTGARARAIVQSGFGAEDEVVQTVYRVPVEWWAEREPGEQPDPSTRIDHVGVRLSSARMSATERAEFNPSGTTLLALEARPTVARDIEAREWLQDSARREFIVPRGLLNGRVMVTIAERRPSAPSAAPDPGS